MEIRIHGRGGQGGVTCAKILATIHARRGLHVQAFGDYAGERSGAPVRAYARADDAPIRSRNKVYEPDELIVLDPSLLGPSTLAGLRPGGVLILNSAEPAAEVARRVPGFRVVTVDASSIARRHGIGTRSVVIVNTTVVGAYARVVGLGFDLVEATYRHMGLASNLEAAREAFDAIDVSEPIGEIGAPPPAPAALEAVDLVHHTHADTPPLKTGDWRSQMPQYARHLAPCSAWCPAGNAVVDFVQALAHDDVDGAAALLAETTPFPGVCGRVCPGFCMQGCNRVMKDGAVNIRGLERLVAASGAVARVADEPSAVPRRFAVVGGGPAGLSAAYQLARRGNTVTLIEGEDVLGGVMRTGIPDYRLPPEILQHEIDAIMALGVTAQTGTQVGSDDLRRMADEHDALIVSTGLQRLRGLHLPGVTLEGVEQGIEFLHRAAFDRAAAQVSGHVVVLGGGNTAMDCARTALRLGAERVTVAYRRTRDEMPAIAEEIDEGADEGVDFMFLRAPTAFGGDGRVRSVTLEQMELVEADASGRRRPVPTGHHEELACDAVLLALGQGPELGLLPEGWELRDGRIWSDGEALPVFFTGDVATNEGTVVHAIGDGHRIAVDALRALGEALPVVAALRREDAVGPEKIRLAHFPGAAPILEVELAARERAISFDEVKSTLPDTAEAKRCFSCGVCTECDTCLVYCPDGVIKRMDGGFYAIDLDYCKGCGVCVTECPRAALEMVTP